MQYDFEKIFNEKEPYVSEYDLRTPGEQSEYNGVVANITDFGAFVDLLDHRTGLVHISEISDTYVSDIYKVLHVGQRVKVSVLKEENGKISLSMKR